ncbi:MAG: energy-coupling factor transporter transmembrane protein EcfT [Elainellaceae cyanobacterium]
MTFGIYRPGTSFIHRLSASTKLGALALVGIGIFFIDSIPLLLGGLAGVIGLVAIAHIPARVVWSQVRPVLVVLIVLVLAHSLLTHWQTGLMLALRFLILVLLATLTTLTTRTLDMVEAIAQALRPLRRWGVNPEQISLMVAIALRFIPVLLEQIHEIRDAQRARGLERPIVTLLIPLLVRTLHLADDLTDALDARCFDPSPATHEPDCLANRETLKSHQIQRDDSTHQNGHEDF